MKSFRAPLIFILSLVPWTALAQVTSISAVSPSLPKSYERHFALPAMLPFPQQNLLEMLKTKASCRPLNTELWQRLKDYKLNPEPSKIKSIHDSLLAQESGPCFSDLALTYSLGALTVLTAEDERFGSEDFKVQLLYGKEVLAIAGVFLANHDRILFFKKRSPSPDKEKILGSYHCGKTEIHIDPYQSPYDVAATLVHEMEHLFRDKSLLESDLLTAEATVLIDETLAALHAGFVQRDFAMPRGTALRPVEISGDLTFYNRKGDFNEQWAYNNRVNFDENYFFSTVAFKTFFELRSFQDLSPREHTISEYGKNLLQYLSKTYFGKPMGPTTEVMLTIPSLVRPWKFADPLPPKEAIDRIARRLALGDIVTNTYLTWSSEPLTWHLGKTSEKALPVLVPIEQGGKKYFVNFDSLLQRFDQLEKKLKKKSQSCRQFESAIKRGELNHYLGNPARPKEKLGGEGVRPGGEGVRPGGEGVRPEDQLLRPCVHIGDHL